MSPTKMVKSSLKVSMGTTAVRGSEISAAPLGVGVHIFGVVWTDGWPGLNPGISGEGAEPLIQTFGVPRPSLFVLEGREFCLHRLHETQMMHLLTCSHTKPKTAIV